MNDDYGYDSYGDDDYDDEFDGWCDICGEYWGLESHYHCSVCLEQCSMMGHLECMESIVE